MTSPRLSVARYVVGVSLGVASAVMVAVPAGAHGDVASVSPRDGAVLDRSPTAIAATFEHEVYGASNAVVIVDQLGRPWPVSDVVVRGHHVRARVRESLPPGDYAVAIQARSASNHIVSAQTFFAVAGRDGSDQSHTVAADHPTDSTSTGAVGEHDFASGREEDGVAGVRAVELVGLALAAGAGVGSWLVVSPACRVGRRLRLALVLTGVAMLVAGRMLAAPGIGTVSGRLQAALLVELCGGLVLVWMVWRGRDWAAAAASVALVAGVALGGHGGALRAVHLGSASLWAGTVAVIALSWGRVNPVGRALLVRRATATCGALLMLAVVTGLAQLPIGRSIAGRYVDALLIKLGAVGIAIGMGMWTWLRSRRGTLLLRPIAIESVALLTAVAIASVLGTSASVEARRVVSFEVAGGGDAADVRLTPGEVGTNEVAVSFRGGRTDPSVVRVHFRHLELAVSTPPVALINGGAAVETVLAVPGVWEAIVDVAGPAAGDLRARLYVPESH